MARKPMMAKMFEVSTIGIVVMAKIAGMLSTTKIDIADFHGISTGTAGGVANPLLEDEEFILFQVLW